MREEGKENKHRRKRRQRRKKRRRSSSRDIKPVRESVIIFSLFLVLAVTIIACFWAIIPTALRYMRDSLGW